ncbi:MAG: NAD(P)-dependent alcohol dehydrogenase [Deltaproteobacteria bacterium]|jgi:threonine dehydrogenase-like Zn-dependent dehydrogenase|nr:NAD(P)-dependent alcohol dehydrogenase [Deltaproteobacteria bacterium]
MKGFAMLKIGQTGWIEKEIPSVGPLDALIAPMAIAPCTSDIHTVYSGAIGERHNLILGHEAVGRVVEVGKEVREFKPGDKVVVPAITPNWRSVEVQNGVPAQHAEGLLTGWKFSNVKDGVFAEYFHVNDADMNLALLPEGISLEQAAMMPDMMTTGFHGAELADVQYGANVCVIGIGPVGLMAVAASALRGAGRIFAVGSRANCVAVAKAYGATDIVNYKQGDIVQQVLAATGGKGVDHVIVAGGGEEVLGQAVSMAKPGGSIGNINYFGEGEILPIPRLAWGCGMAHKAIRGGLCPGGRGRMERMIALVVHGRIDPAKLVSHRLHGLQGVEEGLALMKDKPADVIKPVVLV